MKTDKQRQLVKFLADYLDYEKSICKNRLSCIKDYHEAINNAIDSFENQNNCTIEILE